MEQLHQVGPVEGVLHGDAEVAVAPQHALLVEGHVVHVGGGVGVELVGAGVAQVRVAGGVVDDHVDVAVLKGADDGIGAVVLLEIDGVHRQILIAGVILIGDQGVALFIITIRAAADGGVARRAHVAVGAGLDDGQVQKLNELPVADTQGDVDHALPGGGALVAGEAAVVAVGVDGPAHGVAHVPGHDLGAVGEIVPRLDGQLPVFARVVALPLADDAAVPDDLKVVVQLDHILVDQGADQLIGVVGGHEGVLAVLAVAVDGEHVVQGGGALHVLAAAGFGDLLLAAAAPAAGRAAQRQGQRQQQRQASFHCSPHISLLQYDAGSQAAPFSFGVAVGPVFVVGADRTLLRAVDVLRRETQLQKPPFVGAPQIHQGLAVRPPEEEPRRVPAQIAGDGLGHVVVGLKAALADGRPHGDADVLPPGAEALHLLQGVSQDVGDRAAPAAVDGADDALLRIQQQGGHAVRREAEEGQAPLRRHDAVRLVGHRAHADVPVGPGDDAHDVPVHLLRHGAVVDPRAHEGGGPAVVFPHVRRIVPQVGAEVQAREGPLAHPAVAGEKGVPGWEHGRGHIDEFVFVLFKKHRQISK